VIATTVGLTASDGAYHSGPLDAYDGRTIAPMLRCLGGFTLGLLAYRAAQSRAVAAWASRDAVAATAVILLGAGLACGMYDLLIYPLFAAVVLVLYGNRGWVGRAFGCRPIHGLGLISYSVYLLHLYFFIPRQWLSRWLEARLPGASAGWVADATVCAALLAASALAYRFIEEPGRRCARRVNKACSAVVLRAVARDRLAA
jgi:peptidoglycan/LPS O-acetylase OafA/YrhL